MMSVSTYNAEILILLDVWQNARKVGTVMPPEKGHRSAYSVLYVMLGSLNLSTRGQSYGINNLISIYRLFYFEDDVFHNVYKYILKLTNATLTVQSCLLH